jgi:hypothetical protein
LRGVEDELRSCWWGRCRRNGLSASRVSLTLMDRVGMTHVPALACAFAIISATDFLTSSPPAAAPFATADLDPIAAA